MKKLINQQDMRQSNAADVFEVIRKSDGITRKQIAEQIEISWGAVSNITARLLEAEYIVEKKAASDGAAGRIPTFLAVHTARHFSIGLDINDSGFRAVLVNLKNEIVQDWSAEADFSSPSLLIDGVLSFLDEIIRSQSNRHLLCVGIAMQGVVDTKHGISVRIPGRPDWKDVPIAKIIEERFSLPAFVEHDPNCLLFAANYKNDKKDTILIRADRGIGMAVMMGGRIINKPGIFEIGHMIVEPNGLPCACGKSGCLEKYASIRALCNRSGKSYPLLLDEACRGDRASKQLFEDAARYLAYTVSNVTHLLNIETVVLCGELWEQHDLFFEPFLRDLHRFGASDTPVVTFCEINNAPLGAAMIANKMILKKIDTSL